MGKERHMKLLIEGQCSVADPDLKLSGARFFSLALPAFLPSAILLFFSGNKGGGGDRGAGPPRPLP